ncbi:uncharacterized protein CTHT_0036080 [Thermochaetoides thermophila DSM 1495]|uniref:Major facilitator superfamily (MFS) profile domain-containing protein n=1 Tax=Chaetomium thermophilum (strain DSM 1495 / CBS 144.50 / IMI 039719) TaxID=759272 RepID=G0S797_CHATD|nr:hypothetical protein CTHT_0036080 [Thermochaetoides thermophila DSM 1495]EGS21741.1 hypothetical protein CTHT_0036080 [Thermochaetoides thermophila DSM 1495]
MTSSGETEKPPKPTDSSSTSGSNSRSDDEPQPHLHARTFLAVVAVNLIYVAQLFALVGAGSQGQIIAGHFGRTDQVTWLTAPITILTVVLGPIVSQAADYWGRKWFLVVLSAFGAIGCLIVSRATSMSMIIAGFTVVGLAFGAQPLLHAVPSEVLPRRLRAWAQGSVMIANGIGLVAGLIVGGALNRNHNPNGWRNHYYISTAIFAAAAVICSFAYRPLPRPLETTLTFKEKISRLDWIGYILLAISLVLFCMGLSWSQNPYPWSDPHTSATFAIGLFFGLILVAYETFVKKDGMFHHGLFQINRNFAISLVCIACEGIAFFAANIYFAFQVNVLITKKVRWVTVLAFLIFVAFFVAMATTTKSTNDPVWGYAVLMGWALGMTLVTLVAAGQLAVTGELISIASGLMISVRSLGGTIGIAIYNAIFIEAMKHLGTNVAKAAIQAGLPQASVPDFIGALTSQNETALGLVEGVNPEIIGAGAGALLDTYAKGFRNVWSAAAAFVALGAILAVFLLDSTKDFNNHIDAPVEKEEDLYSASENQSTKA